MGLYLKMFVFVTTSTTTSTVSMTINGSNFMLVAKSSQFT